MPNMSAQQMKTIREAVQNRPHQVIFSSVVALEELVELLCQKGVITREELANVQRSNFVSIVLDQRAGRGNPQ